MVDYIQPEVGKDAYNCPHCGSYSDQYWAQMMHGHHYIESFRIGECNKCKEITIWEDIKMVFPLTGNAPLPNPDMPEEIKQDYLEARDIITRSPRSACVLLRLCVEKICDEKVSGGDLNEKIGKLVEQGLDSNIKMALDAVRVIGGQAVHQLEMSLKDDTKTALALFEIVNYISVWAHTSKKQIDSIFQNLPDSKKAAINKRDKK